MVDIDHYPWYVLYIGKWSPIEALRKYPEAVKRWRAITKKEREKYQSGVYIFHSLSFWIILAVLGAFVDKIFLGILVGVGIHMILDFIDLLEREEPIYNKICLLYVLKRNKNKKPLKELWN
ncbi:MAG: hypothetical protein NUV97_04110 [archaeon]|nr:hypothetical protein [archaeon]